MIEVVEKNEVAEGLLCFPKGITLLHKKGVNIEFTPTVFKNG